MKPNPQLEEYNPEKIIASMRQEYFESLENEEEELQEKETHPLIGFRIGPEYFAVDITHIKLVIRPPKITQLPLSPPHLLGILNLRGEIKPILDLHPIFDLPQSNAKSQKILIVSEHIQDVGILIDEVLDLYEAQEILPPLNVETKIPSQFLKGKVEIQNQLFLLLDLKTLLQSKELEVKTY